MGRVMDLDTMVSNILAYWDAASPEQRQGGALWYPKAHAIVKVIADEAGIDSHRVAHALAALSPRNPWRWNIFDAYSFAVARAEGRTMPRATTFKRNWAAAWRALDPDIAQPWLTSAPKVRAFVAAILGDDSSVVIDTWAIRIATDGSKNAVRNDKEYGRATRAYIEAASLRGVTPCVMQATTWLVAQSEGLATHRRGRHDLSFKAGTPDWLKEAVTK